MSNRENGWQVRKGKRSIKVRLDKNQKKNILNKKLKQPKQKQSKASQNNSQNQNKINVKKKSLAQNIEKEKEKEKPKGKRKEKDQKVMEEKEKTRKKKIQTPKTTKKKSQNNPLDSIFYQSFLKLNPNNNKSNTKAILGTLGKLFPNGPDVQAYMKTFQSYIEFPFNYIKKEQSVKIFEFLKSLSKTELSTYLLSLITEDFALGLWIEEYYPLISDQECTEERGHMIFDFLESLFLYKTNFKKLRSTPEVMIKPHIFQEYLLLYCSLIENHFKFQEREGKQENGINNKKKKEQNEKMDTIKNKKVDQKLDKKKKENVNKKKIQNEIQKNQKNKNKKGNQISINNEIIVEDEIEDVKERGKEREQENKRERVEKKIKLSKFFTEKIIYRIEKTIGLIEELSIFFDPTSTPHLYFLDLLYLVTFDNPWLRKKINKYLVESLVNDPTCFLVWGKNYSNYISQTNNLILFLLMNWESLKKQPNLELIKSNIEIFRNINSKMFHKINSPQIFNEEIGIVQELEIQVCEKTFSEFQSRIRKRKKANHLLLFILLLIVLVFLLILIFK
ncbi:transmembrane protein [Anaeramoeba flamelloides]|uniref:Transmembrane protein n=1 Tax=Anaeramoeba flamelloides TaxID=1746091 RepID=A0AAV7ZYQ6_9EUKA|nr:transmembrane protein [Anaeramoeba flamelloides]